MDNIILFDGVCNFCNSGINYVIAHDKNKTFKFSPLQSQTGIELQQKFKITPIDLNTILLIKNDKIYNKSTAVLCIAKELNSISKLLFIFIIVPKPLRDIVYSYIAKNRYKWFGKKDTCMIPTDDVKSRFLS